MSPDPHFVLFLQSLGKKQDYVSIGHIPSKENILISGFIAESLEDNWVNLGCGWVNVWKQLRKSATFHSLSSTDPSHCQGDHSDRQHNGFSCHVMFSSPSSWAGYFRQWLCSSKAALSATKQQFIHKQCKFKPSVMRSCPLAMPCWLQRTDAVLPCLRSRHRDQQSRFWRFVIYSLRK